MGRRGVPARQMQSECHFPNVKCITIMDTTLHVPSRRSRTSPTPLLLPFQPKTSYRYFTTITCKLSLSTQHADESSRETLPCIVRSERGKTCAGVTRVELFTVHTSTPHPMHMHTVAPNRLQDDLCNLWRLHISHCQHTHPNPPIASKQTIANIMDTSLRAGDQPCAQPYAQSLQSNQALLPEFTGVLITDVLPNRHLRSAHMVMRSAKCENAMEAPA